MYQVRWHKPPWSRYKSIQKAKHSQAKINAVKSGLTSDKILYENAHKEVNAVIVNSKGRET